MNKEVKKYKKDVPQDDVPQGPAVPDLRLCKYEHGRLNIPPDVRSHFMQCPLFGREWRDILVEFDKDWGTPQAPTPSPTRTAENGTPSGPDAKQEQTPVKSEVKLEHPNFDWKNCFPGAPTTLARLQQKFGSDLTQMPGLTSTCSFYLAAGPELYVVAKSPLHIRADDNQIISHGPGSWLTGDKATKFESNNPDAV